MITTFAMYFLSFLKTVTLLSGELKKRGKCLSFSLYLPFSRSRIPDSRTSSEEGAGVAGVSVFFIWNILPFFVGRVRNPPLFQFTW